MASQCVKYLSCMTVMLFSTVRCRPVYPLSLKFSKYAGQDESDRGSNADRANYDGNVQMDSVNLKENFDSVNIANPPEGVGIFRDPIEVLGPKFPESVIINLCQVNLLVNADIVSDVVFLEKGAKLCDQLCRQYQRIMQSDGPTDVSYMKGYCDYTGITDFSNVTEQDNGEDLHTECTCVYKVRCNQRTNVIMYTFQANPVGFLKVSFTEPNKKHCIT